MADVIESTSEKVEVQVAPNGSAFAPHTVGVAPRRRGVAIGLAERYGLIVVWIAVAVFFLITQPAFRHLETLQIIVGSQSIQITVTLAVIIGLVGGEFDLSVANVLGASASFFAYLNAIQHWPVVPALAVVLVGSVCFALVNAFVVVKIGVPSIIATLGTGTVIAGVATAVTGDATIGGVSTGFVNILTATWLGLPVAFYLVIALGILLYYLLEHTPFGRHFRFIGSSRDVARLAGLPVQRLRVLSLVGCSVLAAIAGFLLAGTSGAADPTVSSSYLLPAFAGAFLGSTVLRPGQFNIWGGFIACYFLVTGVTGLQLDGYSGSVVDVYNGAALVVAVAITTLVTRKRTGGSALGGIGL